MPPKIIKPPELQITEFHGMITVAPQMLRFFELLKRVARSNASVLIRGETGTGKELAASMLHALSARRAGPFRAINCATLTPELLASELFGHVRGAFTGAIKDRSGLFKLADGGSIFLDEVAELPLELQSRLLRVLQERSFVPIGGTVPTVVDVRLMSATHQALRDAVAGGRFREDLMYRIRVVPLFLPRLAEREGDVEALTWSFIERFNQEGIRRVEVLAADVMEALLEYDWPGNIRELRNVIEYAFAIGEGPIITLDELPPELRGEAPPSGQGEPQTARSRERTRLLDALDAAKGRKGKAAEALNMSRSTLWRKLREHQIIT